MRGTREGAAHCALNARIIGNVHRAGAQVIVTGGVRRILSAGGSGAVSSRVSCADE